MEVRRWCVLELSVFPDEANCHVWSKANRCNCRIPESENSDEVMEHERGTPYLNVWCDLTLFFNWTSHFWGSHTKGSITPEHVEKLRNHADGRRMHLAARRIPPPPPPHYVNPVKAFLDKHFPGKWVGRGGSIPWPPRSPDLAALEFFLRGYIKDLVYQTEVQDVEELRRRTTAASDSCTSDAAKHLARGGMLSGRLSGHQGSTCGNLPRNFKTWKLSVFFVEFPMFLSILV
jgi:hypothetical protein